jgi:hypothetical protein
MHNRILSLNGSQQSSLQDIRIRLMYVALAWARLRPITTVFSIAHCLPMSQCCYIVHETVHVNKVLRFNGTAEPMRFAIYTINVPRYLWRGPGIGVLEIPDIYSSGCKITCKSFAPSVQVVHDRV